MKPNIRVMIIFALCLVLLLLPSAVYASEVASGSCGEGVTWTLSDDGTLTISGNGPAEDYEGKPVPWEPYFQQITKLVVEEGVTQLGEGAFSACRLKTIQLPAGCAVKQGVFDYCDTVESIIVADLLLLNRHSFSSEYLQSAGPIGGDYDIQFGISGNTWKKEHHDNLRALREITLPTNITVIEKFGFSDSNWLTAVVIPEGVTVVPEFAFQNCNNLQKVVLPESVTRIEGCAFWECWELVEVEIPSKVNFIGFSAFKNCKKLMKVVIPEGITYIDNETFRGCVSLTDVTLPSTLKTVGDLSFSSCPITSLTLPEGLVSIGDSGFAGYDGKELIFPDSLEKLGMGCFSGAKNLEHVIVPEKVTAIHSTFSLCEKLKTVVLLGNVMELTGSAFAYCPKLESVTFMGAAPEYIEDYIFGQSTGVAYYPASDPSWENFYFHGAYSFYPCAEGHSYGDWEVIMEPTEQYTGEKVRTCLCGHKEYVEIPASNGDNPFTDVPDGKYYTQPILWALEKGITTGKTATTFEPNEPCTRGQIVTFLWRAMGEPEPDSYVNPFTDVKESAYYYKAVLWAYYEGITTGKTDTTFEPKAPCTRCQVVTFLWRTMGKPGHSQSNPFSDIPGGKYYTNAVLWALENGITTGKTATTFLPNDTCTRAQIVTFLYRTLVEE